MKVSNSVRLKEANILKIIVTETHAYFLFEEGGRVHFGIRRDGKTAVISTNPSSLYDIRKQTLIKGV